MPRPDRGDDEVEWPHRCPDAAREVDLGRAAVAGTDTDRMAPMLDAAHGSPPGTAAPVGIELSRQSVATLAGRRLDLA